MEKESIYRINLKGPWVLHDESGATRIKFPCSCQPKGAFQLERRFHRPTGLDAQQIVALKLEVHISPISLIVNDHVVSVIAQTSIDIPLSSHLTDFNSLKLEFEPLQNERSEQPDLALLVSAQLEIR